MGRGEVSRAMTLDQYLRLATQSALAGYYPPVTYYGPNGKPTEREPNDFESYVTRAFMGNPIIFGLMQRRASVFAEARFAWRSRRNGKPGDLLPTDENLDILLNPWPNGTTGELLQRAIQDVDLGGNFYCVRENDRLRRLRPDWVQIVLSGDPLTEHRVNVIGYVYSPGGPDNGNYETYLPDEIVHWSPIPDPLAVYRGMSWITPVLKELAADRAATEHRINHLSNSASLGPVVKPPQGTSLDQFKKFVEAADARHSGPNASGKWVFLAPGSEISTIASTLQQLDLRGITGASETRLAVASGVPAVVAGISEGLQGSSLNAGNYQAAKRAWIDGSLRPLWRSVCAAFGTIVDLPDLSGLDLDKGVEAELWIDSADIAILAEDRQAQAAILSTQMTAIGAGITAGFKPKAVVIAIRDNDLSVLEDEHSGLLSVQMQEPGQNGDQSATDNSGDFAPDTQGQQDYQNALDASRSQILRAQGDTHAGAMIALVPSEQDAHRLAVDGGEPVDELHLTLYYLGDAKDIPASDRKSIVDAVKAAVDRNHVTALQGNVFGAALWNPHGDEPAWVLSVGDPQQRPVGQQTLAAIRRAIGDALAYGAPDFRMVRQHTPWASHVCVAYGADATDADELADKAGPVTFDRLRVAFGGKVTDIPLGDAKRSRISRARRPRDGDGDGFYDPDGKGPLPDRTPAPPRSRPADLTGAKGLSADPAVREVQIENRIRQAYAELPHRTRYVSLADIREHPLVRNLDRAEVDAALKGFVHQPGAYIESEMNSRTLLTARERSAALHIGGEENHYLRLDNATLRPVPKASTKATPAKKATKATPTHLDPDSFPGDIAIRLWSGENPSEIAADFDSRAKRLREAAQYPIYDDAPVERERLLALAEQQQAQTDRLRAVADLPLPPKPAGPAPLKALPAKPAPPKPNPRTVPPAPLPSRPMTPAEQKLADDFAAGRINKAQLRAILTGKTQETFQPEETLAFVRGMVTAGYITELARTGDQARLEAYLRRQNTVTLVAAAPFFGLHIPDNAGHDRIVALFHAQALKLEGPPPPPTRESLMSRKVVDLKASLRAAGLPVSGTKPVLVDRLLAAIQAATGGQS